MTQGVTLRVHDPAVVTLPAEWLGKSVLQCSSPVEALSSASALVVATEWPQYRDIPPADIVAATNGLLVIDANRFLGNLAAFDSIEYAAVGAPVRGIA